MANTLLQSDESRVAVMHCIAYSVAWDGINFSSTKVIDADYKTVLKNTGSVRTTQCDRRLGVKPVRVQGFIHPQPIIHQSATSSYSDGGPTIVYQVLGGKNRIRYVFTGEVAGYVANDVLSNISVLSPSERMLQSVLVTATANMKDCQADVGLMLAESRETLGLFHPIVRVLRGKLKALVPRRTTRLLGTVAGYAASAWLTARYGILPVMSDIDTLRELYLKGFNTPMPIRRERARLRLSHAIANTRVRTARSPIPYWVGNVEITTDEFIVASVFARIKNTNRAAMLGLDVRDIPLTAYELVPYSFVLDWFVDVGGWLKAVLPNPNVVELGKSVGVRKTWTQKTDVWGLAAYSTQPNAAFPISACNHSHTITKVAYQRRIDIALPASPQVNYSLLSSVRQIDGVSLMWQKLSSFLPRPKR